jgi:aminoglycoside phosphotransferase (APT) family kinase protein
MAQGTGSPPGVDPQGVSAWFAKHIAGFEPPLRFRLIAGGRSNLTYEVTDAGGTRYVLRRPPTGHILPKAHDMAREFRVISALGNAGVPVAPALGLCTDESVTGAPFYIMGYVEGVIARSEEDAEKHLSSEARRVAGMSLADTLARIHAVDPDAVGLGDLGRKDGYIARQLRRWYANYQAARDSRHGDPVPDVDEVHDLLARAVPQQARTGVVHGDYRLDNCVLRPDGAMAAVLDWELCTLGDTMADLGQLLVYWPEPGERSALGHAASVAPGFPTRAELVERYCSASGVEVGALDYYQAFAYWKLACILEGVYTRYVLGAMGDDGFDVTSYPDTIRWLAARAREAAVAVEP